MLLSEEMHEGLEEQGPSSSSVLSLSVFFRVVTPNKTSTHHVTSTSSYLQTPWPIRLLKQHAGLDTNYPHSCQGHLENPASTKSTRNQQNERNKLRKISVKFRFIITSELFGSSG